MSTELSSPLLDVIRKAAERKPEHSPLERIRKRMAGASQTVVVLCDCSDSMSDYIGNAGMRKCDHLAIALKDVMAYHAGLKVIAFASTTKLLRTVKELPEPDGSTALAAALEHARKFKPRKTIVISDGLPDDAPAALAEAEKITGVIDTIYCGPEQHPGAQFLKSLARDNGGLEVVWDGYRTEIGSHIRALLPPPEK